MEPKTMKFLVRQVGEQYILEPPAELQSQINLTDGAELQLTVLAMRIDPLAEVEPPAKKLHEQGMQFFAQIDRQYHGVFQDLA